MNTTVNANDGGERQRPDAGGGPPALIPFIKPTRVKVLHACSGMAGSGVAALPVEEKDCPFCHPPAVAAAPGGGDSRRRYAAAPALVWVVRYAANLIHNCVAHPLMGVFWPLEPRWLLWLHDRTAAVAYGGEDHP